jgi:hypothetical protein
MIDDQMIWARSRALWRETGERQVAEMVDPRSSIIDGTGWARHARCGGRLAGARLPRPSMVEPLRANARGRRRLASASSPGLSMIDYRSSIGIG